MTQEIGDSALLDTWAATGAISEPSGVKKDTGWELQEQPPHEYANWLANIFGKTLNHILRNGVPLHNTATAYLIGDIVKVAGVLYQAKADNTNSVPPNVNWQQIAPYPVKNSVEIDAGALQLSGDSASPGNSKYYGTNAAGVKGFHTVVVNGFETGDLKLKYGSGELAGYVRFNNRSIGSGTSGATERENDDTEALFKYIWEADPNIVISGGRGASADADWTANKTMTLPDAKGRALVGIDGMGGTNANRVTDAGSGIDGLVLGAAGGAEADTLTVPQLPAHEHEVTTQKENVRQGILAGGENAADDQWETQNTSSVGDGEPHNTMQPTIIIGTVYIKL